MSAKLNPEQVATVIKAGKILNAQCLAPNMNVKNICQAAGIFRKAGYQWANKSATTSRAGVAPGRGWDHLCWGPR